VEFRKRRLIGWRVLYDREINRTAHGDPDMWEITSKGLRTESDAAATRVSPIKGREDHGPSDSGGNT
jgi:hypothetical protein